MLRGISPLISPDLLDVLYRMGHGDEIVLADAHFPSETMGSRVVRADGLRIVPLLDAILPLLVLDTFVESAVFMMETAPGDTAEPEVIHSYQSALARHCASEPKVMLIERFAFYDKVRSESFAVVATGETAKYGNIILKKGVTPV